MKIIKIFLFITISYISILALAFLNLYLTQKKINSKRKVREDIQLIEHIMNDHIIYMYKRHNAVVSGRGGGFMYDINKVCLQFHITQKGTIETSRNLMVEGIYDLLRRINESEEVRPYLSNYPFNEQNLDYSVVFLDKKFKEYKKGITSVSLINEKLYCRSYGEPGNLYPISHKETYQEALETVQKNHPELLEVQPEENKR